MSVKWRYTIDVIIHPHFQFVWPIPVLDQAATYIFVSGIGLTFGIWTFGYEWVSVVPQGTESEDAGSHSHGETVSPLFEIREAEVKDTFACICYIF
jgi:hypothetical protein